MKKFNALLLNEKKEEWLQANRKMMTLTFFELYAAYKKIRTILFPTLLVNLFKQRYISSVKSLHQKL